MYRRNGRHAGNERGGVLTRTGFSTEVTARVVADAPDDTKADRSLELFLHNLPVDRCVREVLLETQ